MTGPEHYFSADGFLGDLREDREAGIEGDVDGLLAEAQVHATLGVAASLGLGANLRRFDQEAWRRVASSE
jgi:hypothetical protein